MVKTWEYEVEEYLALTGVAADSQTCYAGFFLTGQAKTWFINKYQGIRPLPSLDDFLVAFKEQFQGSHNDADIIRLVETIEQGPRIVPEYSTEFEMLVLQLGNEASRLWFTGHYLRGLNKAIRLAVLPALIGNETLKVMIQRASNVARNLDYGKDLERKTPSVTPRTGGLNTSIVNRNTGPTGIAPAGSMPKFLPGREKLSDSDRRLLMENDGCFFCHKFNAGHKADTCPKRAKFLEEKDTKVKEAKKESISALVVESNSDSEYSLCPKSVPTIKIVSRIAGAIFSSTLADSGAMINVVSEDTVDKQVMPTQLMAPMRIHEPFNPDGTVVKRKVVGMVEIPE